MYDNAKAALVAQTGGIDRTFANVDSIGFVAEIDCI